MSYTYLLDLYKALEQRRTAIDNERAREAGSEPQQQYHAGRRDCLTAFHSYLLETFDRKLPRRLQQKDKKLTGDR